MNVFEYVCGLVYYILNDEPSAKGSLQKLANFFFAMPGNKASMDVSHCKDGVSTEFSKC